MTVQQLLDSGMVSDLTVVRLDKGLEYVATGYRHNEKIKQFGNLCVRNFSWTMHPRYVDVYITAFPEEMMREEVMTVAKVLNSGFVDRETSITITLTRGPKRLFSGHATDEQIRSFAMDEVKKFAWRDDNRVLIDLKE